jgi:predicted DNA-binding protein (MmcQ/YjbR family)
VQRQTVLDYCGSRPGAVEDYPFGDGVAVFKVRGRMFALCPLEGDPPSVSLKCDPVLAEALRASHPAVRPGYHLNKRHWNTVTLDGSVDADEVQEWIDHSHELVVAKLPAGERAALRPDGTEEVVSPRRRGGAQARGHAGAGGRAR